MKRGKKKGRKLHKNGEKGLKNASCRVINSKNFRKFIRRGKKVNLKRGEEEMIEMHNIYPWLPISMFYDEHIVNNNNKIYSILCIN